MKEISVLILAYLLGSIPSGLWIGKVFFNINLREHGSGNTGTTNTFRILGKKAGIIVFAIDFLKGDECWCLTWFLAYPATHFSCLFCSQPVFNQYDFVFECYCCATRHSFGSPSSFDWMDLEQL